MKILLIYNRKTAHNVSAKKLNVVEKLLKENKIDSEIIFTSHSRNAIDISADANFLEYDAIVGAGGDGTLFELINGYIKNSSLKRIPIGIIPLGTGNAFSKDLGFEKPDIKKAIELIKSGKTRRIDLGVFKTGNKTCYFANILGMGFVTDVQKTALHFKFLGNFAYTIGVFYRMLFLKSNKMKIEIDGEKYEYDAILTEISNSRYTGSDYLMAPNAKLDDGLLDITIAKKMSRITLLKVFAKLLTGEHIHFKEIETFQAKQIKIELDEVKLLGPDGEIEGETPVTINCVQNAIEVYSYNS